MPDEALLSFVAGATAGATGIGAGLEAAGLAGAAGCLPGAVAVFCGVLGALPPRCLEVLLPGIADE